MGSYHRSQERFCAKKEKYIFIVESRKRKRRSAGVHKELVEKGIYSTIKVTTDITSILCAKEECKEEDSVGLQISKQLDDQKQLSITTDFRFDR